MSLNTLGTVFFKTKLNNPLQDPSLPHPQVITERKDWIPCGNSALRNPSCPTIHSGLFFSSGIKGHLLEAPPTSWSRLPHCLQPPHPVCLPGLPLAQLGFQRQQGVGSLNVFLPWVRWRRPLRGGFHAWLTAIPQGLNSNPCLMKGRKVVEYHPPPHTHPQLTNYKSQQPATPPWLYIPDGPLSFGQTPTSSSLPSPQLPPCLLHLQPFAVWLLHIWNLLLGSPDTSWFQISW